MPSIHLPTPCLRHEPRTVDNGRASHVSALLGNSDGNGGGAYGRNSSALLATVEAVVATSGMMLLVTVAAAASGITLLPNLTMPATVSGTTGTQINDDNHVTTL